MQYTWSWKPLREDREVPIPRDSSLTAAAQFCFNCLQLGHHALLCRFPPDVLRAQRQQ